jgi:hypothetical protein
VGKTLLLDLIGWILNRRGMPRNVHSRSDDELEKRMLGFLVEGVPAVLIDNCTVPIGGAALCAALTGEAYEGRRLGETQMVDRAIRFVEFWTGNNLQVSDDMERRVIPCAL